MFTFLIFMFFFQKIKANDSCKIITNFSTENHVFENLMHALVKTIQFIEEDPIFFNNVFFNFIFHYYFMLISKTSNSQKKESLKIDREMFFSVFGLKINVNENQEEVIINYNENEENIGAFSYYWHSKRDCFIRTLGMSGNFNGKSKEKKLQIYKQFMKEESFRTNIFFTCRKINKVDVTSLSLANKIKFVKTILEFFSFAKDLKNKVNKEDVMQLEGIIRELKNVLEAMQENSF